MSAFLARVEDIAKAKLESDPKLQYMPDANVTREIMQELDRSAPLLRFQPTMAEEVLEVSNRGTCRFWSFAIE